MNVRTVLGRAYGGALQPAVPPALDMPKSQLRAQREAQQRYYYANLEKRRAVSRNRMRALRGARRGV